MSPALMALSVAGIAPVPRHGIGAYFDAIPFWNDPRLLRDDKAAARLADLMNAAPALVMPGNGAVTVGETLPQAVTPAWLDRTRDVLGKSVADRLDLGDGEC